MKLSPRCLALVSGAALLCSAGSSSVWESNTYADFLKGRFFGVSLTRDGRLTLAPRLETAAETGEAGVWSLAVAPDGTVYFSTGHRGRVYRWKAGEKPSLLWSAPQPEVFALALDARGTLYAGASPDGRIWKIENGKAAEFCDPGEKYIWALAAAPDGTLFAGTGQNGRVLRIAPSGQSEVWYETGQTHVTALAFDAKGRLLAGTEPNGILYRIEGKNRAFVLHDADLPEIRSIVPAADGSIYVAAMGGSYAKRQAQAAIRRVDLPLDFAATLQNGYLAVFIDFYFETPLRRDLDGGLKITLDTICASLGIDDRRVVDIHLVKRIDPLRPRIEIELEALAHWAFEDERAVL